MNHVCWLYVCICIYTKIYAFVVVWSQLLFQGSKYAVSPQSYVFYDVIKSNSITKMNETIVIDKWKLAIGSDNWAMV